MASCHGIIHCPGSPIATTTLSSSTALGPLTMVPWKLSRRVDMSIFEMYPLRHNVEDCFLKAIVTSSGNISPGIYRKLANATKILTITEGDRYLKELETDKRKLLTWIKGRHCVETWKVKCMSLSIDVNKSHGILWRNCDPRTVCQFCFANSIWHAEYFPCSHYHNHVWTPPLPYSSGTRPPADTPQSMGHSLGPPRLVAE